MYKYKHFFIFSLDIVEEKLTNMEIIDKYYKVLFHLCDYENLVSE